jgi:hypothetical protein
MQWRYAVRVSYCPHHRGRANRELTILRRIVAYRLYSAIIVRDRVCQAFPLLHNICRDQLFAFTSAAAVMGGFSSSVTVTVNEQVSPVLAVTFTVVSPAGRMNPRQDPQLTVPQLIVDDT